MLQAIGSHSFFLYLFIRFCVLKCDSDIGLYHHCVQIVQNILRIVRFSALWPWLCFLLALACSLWITFTFDHTVSSLFIFWVNLFLTLSSCIVDLKWCHVLLRVVTINFSLFYRSVPNISWKSRTRTLSTPWLVSSWKFWFLLQQ